VLKAVLDQLERINLRFLQLELLERFESSSKQPKEMAMKKSIAKSCKIKNTKTTTRTPEEQKSLDKKLFDAGQKGILKDVKNAIELGADVHVADDWALKWAASNGHLDVVKCLVELGADIHAVDDYALRWAAEYGHLSVVKYLIEQGADIHANNDEALRWAASNGHLEIVKYLEELIEKEKSGNKNKKEENYIEQEQPDKKQSNEIANIIIELAEKNGLIIERLTNSIIIKTS